MAKRSTFEITWAQALGLARVAVQPEQLCLATLDEQGYSIGSR